VLNDRSKLDAAVDQAMTKLLTEPEMTVAFALISQAWRPAIKSLMTLAMLRGVDLGADIMASTLLVQVQPPSAESTSSVPE
jgi:hypothetical protein